MGELLAALQASVKTRSCEWKGLVKDPIYNRMMTLYELKRNSSVEVTKTISDELRDSTPTNVHTDVGDILMADSISLFVDTRRNSLRFVVKEGESGRHGAQLATTSMLTVAKIKYPLKIYARLLGSQQENTNNKLEDKR